MFLKAEYTSPSDTDLGIWKTIKESTWELLHVGLIVEDLDKILVYYESLGLVSAFYDEAEDAWDQGTFENHGETRTAPSPSRKGTHKLRIIKMGPLPVEIIQPGEASRSANAEFFDRKGEGISHIGFLVDDLEAETTKLVEKGVPIIMTGRIDGKVGMHYFDTRKYGGLTLELLQKGGAGDWKR